MQPLFDAPPGRSNSFGTRPFGRAGALPSRTLGGVFVGSSAVRRALVFSVWDGIAATVMLALTDTFGVAAAVSLRAHNVAIALLGSAPLLVGSLVQYFLPAIVDLQRKRKACVLLAVGIQATALIGAGVVPSFLSTSFASWGYVACFALAAVASNVSGAAWTSWMGDLVPPDVRGRHFAWRSRVFSFASLCCALLAGVWAGRYSSSNTPWQFFALVFVGAGACRVISFEMLRRQDDPQKPVSADVAWRARPSPALRRFSVANGLLQGATAMSGPFFTVWFLRDLHFSYLVLAVAGCSSILGNIVSLPVWGALADRIGTGRVLRIAAVLASLVPFPYCFTGDYRVIWLLGVFSGISWAGYNLASFNQVLRASDNKNRAPLVALVSVTSGILVFALTLIAGGLTLHLPLVFTWRLQSLFLLSGTLRFVAVFMLPKLDDLAVEPANRRPTSHVVSSVRAVDRVRFREQGRRSSWAR